ncbi:MAG TPA: class I SAM-dependent methyltransferase [Sphingobium sp.]|nr:class I SAM-dependent methyltransferase [Sphingobium sp.]
MSPEYCCNACNGPLDNWLTMPIDAKKNTPMIYRSVLRCRTCSLGVLSPMPDPGAIPEFYRLGSYYTHDDGASHIPPIASGFADKLLTKAAWIFDREQCFLPEKVAARLPAGGTVCDLGCGDAKYLARFKALGFAVTGVDPDPTARAHAAKAAINVEVGTAEAIPAAITERSFDLVLMTHSLEHCRDPKLALRNALALTRPGGLCYVEVPNCASEHFRTFTIASEMFDAPRHIYFFTPASLQQIMEQVGFVPVQKMYQGYVRNFDPGWRGWETTIAERVTQAEPTMRPRRHSFGASVALFMRSFWRRPEQKYDSIGFLMQRPAN